jgi:hypothetical protein
MSRAIELSDEQYETIARVAASRGITPDAVLAQLIDGLRDPLTQPRYYELEDWFRHLEGEDAEGEGHHQDLDGADADP